MQHDRVSAFVTFHYRRQSLHLLDRVLRNLAEFNVQYMHATVVTSSEDAGEHALLYSLCRNYFGVANFAIEVFPNCKPGFLLTWKHKPLLSAAVADVARSFSHFIYVEDDIGLTYRNFQYFTEYANPLRERGLIPSFLRTEFMDGVIRSCDATEPTVGPPLIKLLNCTFASPRFPYCACFVMDRLHVSEYLSSRSFDFDLSQELCDWGIPERAAMGLCWEKPPSGFSHRYVLPVSSDLRPLFYCEVPHMSVKYAGIANSLFGKIPVESVFVRAEGAKAMYLVTAHDSIVAVNNEADLVHVSYAAGDIGTYVEINDADGDKVLVSGPLHGFRILHTKDGVNLLRDGSFLCAEPGNRQLVANRKKAGPWETFFLVSEDALQKAGTTVSPQARQIGDEGATSLRKFSLQKPDPMRRIILSPETDDELVRHVPTGSRSPEKWEDFNALLVIQPTKKAAVVVAMRNDGISVLQWIAHHRALGFDGIFIYSNDNTDGSEVLLTLLAEAGIITYIENRCSPTSSPQIKAFEHSIHRLPELRDYKWVYYADSDEFLDLADRPIGVVLHDVDSRFPEGLPSAICVRWRWFTSNFVYERRPGLLLRQFQHSKPHHLFKSIVRLADVVSMRRLHFPDLIKTNFFVDANLQIIAESTAGPDMMWQYRETLPSYAGGCIRHYWHKSFEEFTVKKIRGDTLCLDNNFYTRGFAEFFEWNQPDDTAERTPPRSGCLARSNARWRNLSSSPASRP